MHLQRVMNPFPFIRVSQTVLALMVLHIVYSVGYSREKIFLMIIITLKKFRGISIEGLSVRITGILFSFSIFIDRGFLMHIFFTNSIDFCRRVGTPTVKKHKELLLNCSPELI